MGNQSNVFNFNWPVLFYCQDLQSTDCLDRVEEIQEKLSLLQGLSSVTSFSLEEFKDYFNYNENFSAVFAKFNDSTPELIKTVRAKNNSIPIILFTEKRDTPQLSPEDAIEISDCYVIFEDEVDFIAGRILDKSNEYINNFMPPFFGELVKYVKNYKYPWHTPGHMGGLAFLKNPPGKAFHEFLGETVFRADLSISVPELGSLLDHSGPVRTAEQYTAKVFGADESYFVLNGTSTVNQIIWKSRVTLGDLSWVDRNCHKSLNYGMVVSEATPSYIIPRRNKLGIIGPVYLNEFSDEYIQKAIDANPLIPEDKKNAPIQMSALTNSTYDGLCYNVEKIKEAAGSKIKNFHFDEAWYAYAHFHPIYKDHYGMTPSVSKTKHAPILVSQSTHKLLAAFSQCSMLHIKNGTDDKFDPEIFNEAYMMYGSTSPQYNFIASLDVASAMMDFNGEKLMDDTIKGAIEFRKDILNYGKGAKDNGEWGISVWQPLKVNYNGKMVDFTEVPTDYLASHQECWVLSADNPWHGFDNIEDNYVMLDPIKVTVRLPGIGENNEFEEVGIPASIFSNFIILDDIVNEKTDYYTLLLLNSIATTKSKQNSFLTALKKFKKLYETNAPLSEVFPDLVKSYPERYGNEGLRDHCQHMHKRIQELNLLGLLDQAFEIIPTPVMTPAEASREVFRKNVEHIRVADLMNRTGAVMLVPYPPGIPVLMGGEKIDESSKIILDFLLAREQFEIEFPGYYSDIHGVEAHLDENGVRRFYTMALK
jgi:lysine decarboxylase/arginine decarboxylase